MKLGTDFHYYRSYLRRSTYLAGGFLVCHQYTRRSLTGLSKHFVEMVVGTRRRAPQLAVRGVGFQPSRTSSTVIRWAMR